MFIGSVVLNLFVAQHVVMASQQQWCTVLELLTAKPVAQPVDPQKDKARQAQYIFYLKLKTLESGFHC